MSRKKMTPQQAKAALMADGMTFQEDFHALGSSAVGALGDMVKLTGYRKSKNAPGSTVRMFYQYLSRVAPVVRAPGELSPAERRAYQARARQAHSTTKSPPMQSQRGMMDKASRQLAEVYETFLEMLPTMRRKELESLIKKRPALWGRFAGYLTSGHVFVDDPVGPVGAQRDHATKKSPAQLEREIAEVLAKTPEGFKIGDAVQLRWEPGTGGVIRRLASGRASVSTPRGEREVPVDALVRVRKEHEARVRRSAHSTKTTGDRPLIAAIQAGDHVTIVDRFGKQHTGRAVMRGPHGWVLNLGGRHGTPGIATDDNVTRVRCGKK